MPHPDTTEYLARPDISASATFFRGQPVVVSILQEIVVDDWVFHTHTKVAL